MVPLPLPPTHVDRKSGGSRQRMGSNGLIRRGSFSLTLAISSFFIQRFRGGTLTWDTVSPLLLQDTSSPGYVLQLVHRCVCPGWCGLGTGLALSAFQKTSSLISQQCCKKDIITPHFIGKEAEKEGGNNLPEVSQLLSGSVGVHTRIPFSPWL